MIRPILKKLSEYEKLIEENPGDYERLLEYARLSLHTGYRLKALKAINRVKKVKPDCSDAYLYLAKIFYELKLYPQSLKELLDALQLDPNNIYGRFLYEKLLSEVIEKENKTEYIPPFAPNLGEIEFALKRYEILEEDLVNELKAIEEAQTESPEDVLLEFDHIVVEKEFKEWQDLIEYARFKLEEEYEKKRKEEEETRKRLQLEEIERKRAEEEARRKAYQDKLQELSSVFEETLNQFAEHKMIACVLLVDLCYGLLVKKAGESRAPGEKVAQMIAVAVNKIKDWGDSRKLDYWVIEYKDGLLFLEIIAENLSLVVIGDKGSNLGAMRIVIDKYKLELLEKLRHSKFTEILQSFLL